MSRKEEEREQEALGLDSPSRWVAEQGSRPQVVGALPSTLRGPGLDWSTHPPRDTTSFTFTL